MRGVTVHFALQPLRSLQAPREPGQKPDQVRGQHHAPSALRSTGATTARAVRQLLESTLGGVDRDDFDRDDFDRDGFDRDD
jgi:hypothetical protein